MFPKTSSTSILPRIRSRLLVAALKYSAIISSCFSLLASCKLNNAFFKSAFLPFIRKKYSPSSTLSVLNKIFHVFYLITPSTPFPVFAET